MLLGTKSYKIIRFYQRHANRIIKEGLTLEEAKAHCSNSMTSSATCFNSITKKKAERLGAWFDGYTEE